MKPSLSDIIRLQPVEYLGEGVLSLFNAEEKRLKKYNYSSWDRFFL